MPLEQIPYYIAGVILYLSMAGIIAGFQYNYAIKSGFLNVDAGGSAFASGVFWPIYVTIIIPFMISYAICKYFSGKS